MFDLNVDTQRGLIYRNAYRQACMVVDHVHYLHHGSAGLEQRLAEARQEMLARVAGQDMVDAVEDAFAGRPPRW